MLTTLHKGLAILGLSLLLSACSLLPKEEEALIPPLVKPAAVSSTTVPAKKDKLVKAVTGSAVFESNLVVHQYFPEYGGRLDELYVKAGDAVKKGDILLQLKTEGLDIELLQKQVNAERKKLALDEAKSTSQARLIKIAELDLKIATKELEKIEEQMSGKQLLAEKDGIVTYVTDLAVGEATEPYSHAVTIADPAHMNLTLSSLSTEAVKDVKEGMKVSVTFESQQLEGKVVQTPSSAPYTDDVMLKEKYTRNVYIAMDKLPEQAKLGSLANVEIITAQRENTIIIPAAALHRNFGRTYVQVLDGERRREVDVQVGLETASSAEILEGLEEGQEIIIR